MTVDFNRIPRHLQGLELIDFTPLQVLFRFAPVGTDGFATSTASSHIELKDVDKGKKELEQLIVKYPDHPVAEMARGRLRGLTLGQ